MTHQISKKCDIVALFQKVFCEAMAERVRINNGGINTIAFCQLFQLPGNPPRRDPLPETVQKNEAAFLLFFVEPGKGFILQ